MTFPFQIFIYNIQSNILTSISTCVILNSTTSIQDRKQVRILNETDTRLTLTVEEAAKLLGVSRIKGYELAHSEGFPAMRLGRKLLIPRDRFLAWIDQQAGTAASSGR